jgi:nitroimidazol reductase NimA-like FMN-containing flavoprotein (pyridoxamine 5'-phosphate oxidase superfamily)
MLVHELTLAECRAVLVRVTIGRLACARADQPYIVPILFSFDPVEDFLYSFSMLGRKIDWMRGNPKVCVEVDEIDDHLHWTTIVAFGRYEEILDSARAAHARRRAHELFERRPEWWLPGAARLATGDEHAIPVVYRIHIDTMTGRRAARPPRG